jgi:hypothetical protein
MLLLVEMIVIFTVVYPGFVVYLSTTVHHLIILLESADSANKIEKANTLRERQFMMVITSR